MSFLQKEEVFSSQLRREMRHEHRCRHPKEMCDKLIDTWNTASNLVIPTSGPGTEGEGHGRSSEREIQEQGPAVTLGIIREEARSKYPFSVEKREFLVGEQSVLTKGRGLPASTCCCFHEARSLGAKLGSCLSSYLDGKETDQVFTHLKYIIQIQQVLL